MLTCRPVRAFRKTRHAALAVWLLLLGALSVARAAEAAQPIRLDYLAEGSCPDADAFLSAVLARSTRLQAATGSDAARTLHVTIARGEDGNVEGSFSLSSAEDPLRPSVSRTISGASCSEVFDALTLFAALSLDPLVDEPAAPANEQRVQPSAAPLTLPVSNTSVTPRAASHGARWRAALGAHIGLMSARTASTVELLEPFGELSLHAWAAPLTPAVRLGFSTASADSAASAQGFARLHWTVARVDACPLELRLGAQGALRPCLSASGGVLSARGERVDHPRAPDIPWWTMGGLLRGEWNFSGSLALEADAGLDSPLRRSRLYFEPETRVYRAPAILTRITLGLALHF